MEKVARKERLITVTTEPYTKANPQNTPQNDDIKETTAEKEAEEASQSIDPEEEKRFIAYLKLQKAGTVNMFDSARGSKLTNMSVEEYEEIQKTYKDLMEKYPLTYEATRFGKDVNKEKNHC